jgi:hypothetical protein
MGGNSFERLAGMRHCRSCRVLFSVCNPCDRGQAYCSSGCRRAARARQTRATNARYLATEAGRTSNRDRQRRFRERRRGPSVTDHSSPMTAGGVACATHRSEGLPVANVGIVTRPTGRASLALRCIVCRRAVEWVDIHRRFGTYPRRTSPRQGSTTRSNCYGS